MGSFRHSADRSLDNLATLLDEHERLDDLFLAHQALLVEGNPPDSLRTLEETRAGLLGHIRGEEEVILPFYGATVEIPKGGAVEYFLNEHRKLSRLIDEATLWCAAWSGLSWPPREVVLLVERERTFKEVMEHHDERERNLLYPRIDSSANPVACREIVDRFWQVAAKETRRCLEEGIPDATPARAGARACLWIEPIYAALASGEARPRGAAPWGEALQKVWSLRRLLEEAPAPAEQAHLLEDLIETIDGLTPLKRFPPDRVAEAHGALHLLEACHRAVRARAGLTP